MEPMNSDPSQHLAPDPDDHPIRVLVVDDHPLLRDVIKALLDEQDDMELVAEAANGREGIELFRMHNPDITLMDLNMPDKNGIEAITAIRQAVPEARKLAADMRPRGDLDSADTWLRIIVALGELRNAPVGIASRGARRVLNN